MHPKIDPIYRVHTAFKKTQYCEDTVARKLPLVEFSMEFLVAN